MTASSFNNYQEYHSELKRNLLSCNFSLEIAYSLLCLILFILNYLNVGCLFKIKKKVKNCGILFKYRNYNRENQGFLVRKSPGGLALALLILWWDVLLLGRGSLPCLWRSLPRLNGNSRVGSRPGSSPTWSSGWFMISILITYLCSKSCEETTFQAQILHPGPAAVRGTKLGKKKEDVLQCG